MDTTYLNRLHRATGRDPAAPWSATRGIPRAAIDAYMARGRQLRAEAVGKAFASLARRGARRLRRLARVVPSGALGPSAYDMDCAHGRPC